MNYKKIWIMPIAGKGSRTKDFGKFKPFIIVGGKYIIEWFFISILDKIHNEDEFIFITTSTFEKEFFVSEIISNIFKKYKINNKPRFKIVSRTPKGPAKSIEKSLELVNPNAPIIIINVDQFILFKLPNEINNKFYLVANIDLSNSKSYIQLDNKKIIGIVEKINNSNIASSGVYIFPSLESLKESLYKLFKSGKKVKNEFYVADAMNLIINNNEFEILPSIAKFDLGNINGINYFNYIINSLKEDFFQ